MVVNVKDYTQLQDDGCPNCPEHIGEAMPPEEVVDRVRRLIHL